MSRDITSRLRAALVAKANTVTEAELQPGMAASITLHAPAGLAWLGATGPSLTPPASILATGGDGWQSFPDPCRAIPHTSL
jgi:hypothetical protein